jgi:hypothetical protein
MQNLDPSILSQVYSFTRIVTLASIIVTLIGIDTTKPINCQVCAVSCIHLVIQKLDVLQLKGLDDPRIREQAFSCVWSFDQTMFCSFSLFF